MARRKATTGPCGSCGRPATRQLAEGAWADVLNALPLTCAKCQDAQVAEEQRAAADEAAGRSRRRVESRRAASGLPAHLAAFTFSELQPDVPAVAREEAEAWAESRAGGLLLIGPTGVGKTRIAVAAANRMMERRAVRWYSAATLMARLGSGDFSSPHREAAVEALCGTAPLVLDDVDKARPTAYAAEAMFNAVDVRADGGGPLLVTSNLALRELAGRWPEPYGEAIASRLSLLRRVTVEGRDRRTAA